MAVREGDWLTPPEPEVERCCQTCQWWDDFERSLDVGICTVRTDWERRELEWTGWDGRCPSWEEAWDA